MGYSVFRQEAFFDQAVASPPGVHSHHVSPIAWPGFCSIFFARLDIMDVDDVLDEATAEEIAESPGVQPIEVPGRESSVATSEVSLCPGIDI